MLRPGGSSLSLRAIGSSLRNLNSISTERLDERVLLLMPPVITTPHTTTTSGGDNNSQSSSTITTTQKRYGDRLSANNENNKSTGAVTRPSLQTPPASLHLGVAGGGGGVGMSRSINDLSPVAGNDWAGSQPDYINAEKIYVRQPNKFKALVQPPDESESSDDGLRDDGVRKNVEDTSSLDGIVTAVDTVAVVGITNESVDDDKLKKELTHVYFKRWIILGVFCLITMLNSFNWIIYGIIQNVTIAFYNESLPQGESAQIEAVNWFSMVYMLAYIPLVFPTMFLLERKGLRLSCVLGALFTFIGVCIKCAAVRPDLFSVAMLGQSICAIAQSFTLGIPARLSALWFGPDEIGLATSIGVFGNQLGTALGFLIPPNVVLKSDSVEFMQQRFLILLIPVAVLCGISVILAIFLVKDQPEKPPSLAQLEIRKNFDTKEAQESDFRLFKSSLKDLFKNFNYFLILVSYGVNTGVYYALGTQLNFIISKYYANENEKIGIIGLILVLSGLLGAVIGGIILDKTKAFKLTTFVIYACSFGAMVLFTFTISINIWIIFATSFLLGFFMTGYLPVGFELAAEVTYPASEGTSCGLLNMSAQIFGIFFTYAQGRIIIMVNALVGNLFVSGALLVGTVITALVKSDLRRQKAINVVIERTTHTNTTVQSNDRDSNVKKRSKSTR